MSSDIHSDEIKALALKLAGVTDRIEQRLLQVTDQTLKASSSMVYAVQQSHHVSSDMTRNALAEFRVVASGAATDGLRGAAAGYEQTLAKSAQGVSGATAQLEARIRQASALHWATAWKAFAAIFAACLVVIGVAGYMIWLAHDATREAKWVAEVQAAVSSGRLSPCPDSGLCAVVNKRWVRLDR